MFPIKPIHWEKPYLCVMKRCVLLQLYLLPVLLCSLAACRTDPYPPVLLQADRLAGTCPDSAIALLAGAEADMHTEPERTQMYYRLLCIKACDKAYIRHTSDSMVLAVLNYYIEQQDTRHLPEAYYYAGRVHCDMGDTPQALGYFEKALAALPPNDTSILKEKIVSQMGTLFYYQHLFTEALDLYKESLRLSFLNNDSTGLFYGLRDVADIYFEMNEPDSVLHYYTRAGKLSRQLQRSDWFYMIQRQLANLYTAKADYEAARLPLQQALAHTDGIDKSAVYSIAADYYRRTGQQDSAAWYHRALLECGTIYAKEAAYRELLRQAIGQKDWQKATGFLDGYQTCIDSVQRITQTETVHRMYALYNYRLRESQNLRLEARNREQASWLWITTLSLMVVALCGVIYWLRSQRQKKQLEEQLKQLEQIAEENRQKAALQEKLNSQREELERNLQRIMPAGDTTQTARLQRKMQLINSVLAQNEVESAEEAEGREALFQDPLYRDLQARAHAVREDGHVTPEEWDTLRTRMQPAFPRFFERLRSLHPAPNANELHVCILIKLDFSPADIARLLGLKRETIYSIRKRLYKKVTGTNGTAEDWDKIVLSL